MIDATLETVFEAVGEAALWLAKRTVGGCFNLEAADAYRVGEWIVLGTIVLALFLLTVLAS
ncbi:MAG TPA: hypothetical protein PK620_12710 [Denitromonas sp.]|uniref:hypothetical protein n=1 Tax=Denitromonas sp. TaxID=2734609 RepID=UPI001DB89835|nr:hypothetical protein [Rhodocyclaceae bacterium]MCP5222180.1 hypothetical protein [Zoogloeaceae bacterium]HPR07388.1 hypothetical protein [Denitromonas sp.]HQU89217.1 hypothetical protein [Denitromonas sp.]HQV15771.1 hypothetical protein [Denitromonas sp.]